MKLIIDIPKGTYEAVKVGTINQVLEYKVWNAIKNGTPFDSVIEDIKQEIEEFKSCCDDDWDAFLIGRKEAYNNVLQIIDKHIGKAESEDKE